MQVKEIVVETGCNLSPRSYNNIQEYIKLIATPDEGEDPARVLALLSNLAREQLITNITLKTSEMDTYERRRVFEMVGIPMPALPEPPMQNEADDDFDPEAFEDDDDSEDDEYIDDEPPNAPNDLEGGETAEDMQPEVPESEL